MDWTTDWGLRGRMALTGFLLFVVYLVFAVAIVEILGGGPVFALFILGGFSLVQYFFSDTLALRSIGAREVSEDEYPALHDTITRLSRQADLPKPTVAVADSRVPNALVSTSIAEYSQCCSEPIVTAVSSTATLGGSGASSPPDELPLKRRLMGPIDAKHFKCSSGSRNDTPVK